ncbi:hypothetical protein FGG08_006899 [Glutinoglossum americanum]|uniref:Uncharacterized protein n=1 Tax=Glutinoglossum americanum TaxID=1670608 RepID=A0A9P8HV36_9PEZI|nr:hypothetical protein FGG08_006899 [Glutinoglossum americanum]
MFRPYVYVLGISAFITTGAGVTYMIIFAVTLTSNRFGIRILSIVAAVTNLLALALAFSLTPRFTHNHHIHKQIGRQRLPEGGPDAQHFVKTTVRPVPELSRSSPTRSATPSEAKRTLRSSLSSVVRPVISRTRLATRDSTSLDGGSGDDVPEHDGFDSWDTSGVGSQARQAVLISSLADVEHFSKGIELEPIPGSRPGSQIFWSCHHSESDSDSQKPRGSGLADSPPRSLSQSIREAHIHPLFRSDSPTPPPTASPGTVVRASPLGGQIFTGSIRTLKRPGASASNASPLVIPYGFDGEVATQRPSSVEIPPPLRDFILPPSPRSIPTSPNGFGKRKAALSSTVKASVDKPSNA